MRLPRKGILIRIVVYGGLLGFFGWRAIGRHLAGPAEDPAEDPADTQRLEELKEHSRTVTLPNGQTQVIYEITPEQAERLFGVRPTPSVERAESDQTDSGSAQSGGDASTASR